MADARPANKILRVLILDDSPDDTEQASAALRHAGFMLKTQRLETGVAVEQNLESAQWDLILCAHGLNHLPARQVVELVARKHLLIPVIIMARRIGDDEVRSLMQAGARDVIMKGQWGRLVPAVERELATVHDRRAALDAREALRNLEARYRTMIEASLEAIAYVQDGMHMDANAAYRRLFGYDDLDGLKETPLLNLIDKTDQNRFKQALKKPEGADKPQEFTAVGSDGQKIMVEVALTPLTINGEACIQVVATDISKRKALENKLQSMHQRDALTGLLNRAHFLTALGDHLKKPGGALIGVTINRLAELNQALGHVSCDRLLVQVGQQLRDLAGTPAALARLGGGQFAILLDAAAAGQADALVAKIRDHLDPVAGDGSHAVKPEISVTGCALNGSTGDRQAVMDQVFKPEERAAAIPVAPRVAKPATAPSTPAPPVPAAPASAPPVHAVPAPTGTHDLREPLAQALAHNKLELYFQPIINLHGEPQPFYEARFMLRTADDQLVPPARYMATAEAAGFSGKIDRAMLLNAIDILSKHHAENRPGMLFATLSGAAVKDGALLTAIQMHMKATGLHPRQLILQLDESVFARHPDATREFIQKTRSIGIGFALDRFTAQQLGMEQLAGFAVDFLAVDCGPEGLADDALFNAIDAGHALEKTVIARNLEDAELFSTLFSRGVHYVQGDYLQPPTSGLDYNFEAEQTLTSDEPIGPSWRVAG